MTKIFIFYRKNTMCHPKYFFFNMNMIFREYEERSARRQFIDPEKLRKEAVFEGLSVSSKILLITWRISWNCWICIYSKCHIQKYTYAYLTEKGLWFWKFRFIRWGAKRFVQCIWKRYCRCAFLFSGNTILWVNFELTN